MEAPPKAKPRKADTSDALPGLDIMSVARQNAELQRQLEASMAKQDRLREEVEGARAEAASMRLDQRIGSISSTLASQMHLSRIAVDAIVRQYHGEVADIADASEAATKLAATLKAKDESLFRPVDVTGQGSLRAAPQLRVAGGYDPFSIRSGKAK